MNDPLEKLTQNAFPTREVPPPSARMWSRIEADLPQHASRNRLWLPAAAAMATLLMAIGLIQFGSQPDESEQKNDEAIHSLLASNRQTEHWLQAERPLVYQQNQEAIAALHMAIEDLINPATPAAISKCPTLALTDPTAQKAVLSVCAW